MPQHNEACSSLPSSYWSTYSHLEAYEVPVYHDARELPHPDGVFGANNSDLTCLHLAMHDMIQALPDVVFWTVTTVTFVAALSFLAVYEMGWLLVYIARSVWKKGKNASFKRIWKGVRGWKGWGAGLQA